MKATTTLFAIAHPEKGYYCKNYSNNEYFSYQASDMSHIKFYQRKKVAITKMNNFYSPNLEVREVVMCLEDVSRKEPVPEVIPDPEWWDGGEKCLDTL